MSERLLTRADLEEIFDDLARELAARRAVVDIYVFGGAAIVLQFDERQATRDVDAVWETDDVVRAAAAAVAERRGLPHWWLNDQASAFVSSVVDAGSVRFFERASLRVTTASPKHLFAMKVFASRQERDFDDLLTLGRALGVTTTDEALAICAELFPGGRLDERHRTMLERVVEALRMPGADIPR